MVGEKVGGGNGVQVQVQLTITTMVTTKATDTATPLLLLVTLLASVLPHCLIPAGSSKVLPLPHAYRYAEEMMYLAWISAQIQTDTFCTFHNHIPGVK